MGGLPFYVAKIGSPLNESPASYLESPALYSQIMSELSEKD